MLSSTPKMNLYYNISIKQNHVYAGEHPFIKRNIKICYSNINSMLNEGFAIFIDLTEPHELPPYSQWLPVDCCYINFPIKNLSVPFSMEDTFNLIKSINECMKDKKMYIHCYGGVGRTGMIVACLLSYYYHDYDYESVMGRFQEVYKNYTKSAYMNAPETTTQREFIKQFIQFMKSGKGRI